MEILLNGQTGDLGQQPAQMQPASGPEHAQIHPLVIMGKTVIILEYFLRLKNKILVLVKLRFMK